MVLRKDLRQKKTWWSSRPAVGVLSLVVGITLGSAAGGGSAKSAEISELSREKMAIEQDLASAEQKVALFEAEENDIEQLENELKAKLSQEETRLAEIASRESALVEAEKVLTERENAVIDHEANAVVSEEPVPQGELELEQPEYVPESEAPTSIYYKNCTEARNAGAAPVYSGDPGYASHLDRDGDGVGCEK